MEVFNSEIKSFEIPTAFEAWISITFISISRHSPFNKNVVCTKKRAKREIRYEFHNTISTNCRKKFSTFYQLKRL